MADDESTDELGGAVGGVAPADLPRIVANLVADGEEDRELRIRPERIGTRYTVEWTTVEYNWNQLDWEPLSRSSPASGVLGTVCTGLQKVLYRITSIFNERMPSFDVDHERINAFEIDGTYLFKHYFDQDEVFAELRRYYNESEYRFEVPADALTDDERIPAVVSKSLCSGCDWFTKCGGSQSSTAPEPLL